MNTFDSLYVKILSENFTPRSRNLNIDDIALLYESGFFKKLGGKIKRAGQLGAIGAAGLASALGPNAQANSFETDINKHLDDQWAQQSAEMDTYRQDTENYGKALAGNYTSKMAGDFKYDTQDVWDAIGSGDKDAIDHHTKKAKDEALSNLSRSKKGVLDAEKKIGSMDSSVKKYEQGKKAFDQMQKQDLDDARAEYQAEFNKASNYLNKAKQDVQTGKKTVEEYKALHAKLSEYLKNKHVQLFGKEHVNSGR